MANSIPGAPPNVVIDPQTGLDKVDPRLLDIVFNAAADYPYKVEIISGYREGPAEQRHGAGAAIDVQLYDAGGKAIPNYQNEASFRAYEQFAQTAKAYQEQAYPALNGSNGLAWGGYFSGPIGGPNAMDYSAKNFGHVDLMHLSLNEGMRGGTWQGGLTAAQQALIPHASSVGMAAAPQDIAAKQAWAPVSGFASTNPTPGNLSIPDMMGVLGPQSTAGFTALGGIPEGAARYDTPPVNAPQSGLSLQQITAMLGDLSGNLGLLPSDGTPAQAAGNYFYPPDIPQGQPYFGPGVENQDNYHYPPEQAQGQPYFGPAATPDAQAQTGGFLPIPAYTGSYAGTGGFQPADVPSFPDLGGHVDQVASGYDPTNPPSHDGTDTSNLYAAMWPFSGGNQPGANAPSVVTDPLNPAYDPVASRNASAAALAGWQPTYTAQGNTHGTDGGYIFGPQALSAFAAAAGGKSTEPGSATGMVHFIDPTATAAGQAVRDASFTYAPDSSNEDLKRLGQETAQVQKYADAAKDPIWGAFGGMASDIAGMFAPFAMGSGTPPVSAYAETPPANAYDGKSDPKTAVDAVNWMGGGGLGLNNDPTATQFGGFSGGMGDAFDPYADPFAKKEEKAPQQPAYTSPISGNFSIPQSGWASFGAGTLGGQPWSLGSGLPPPSLLPPPVASAPKTREFVPQPMSYASSAPQASASIMIGPPVNPYAPPPGMDPNYGGIFQVPGMGPSFDPGSFSDQDAEALASAATAQDQTKTALCSYFMRKGRIPKDIWKAETRYSYRFSRIMREGYHAWAKPCVRAMERGGVFGSLLDLLLFPVASSWAKEMAFRMGVGDGSRLGAMFHVILGGFSTALGWLLQQNELPQEDF